MRRKFKEERKSECRVLKGYVKEVFVGVGAYGCSQLMIVKVISYLLPSCQLKSINDSLSKR